MDAQAWKKGAVISIRSQESFVQRKKKKWRLHLKSQEMLVGLRQWVSSFKDFRGRIIPNAFKLRKGSSLLEELTEEEYGQHWKRGEKRCEVRVER